MHIRIKSDELVRHLKMGWRLSQMAITEKECWLTMEGSVKARILDDLGLLPCDITDKKTIPGTRATHRMLCCWYGVERFGLKYSDVARLFKISRKTARNAHERVGQLIKVGPINLPDAAKK